MKPPPPKPHELVDALTDAPHATPGVLLGVTPLPTGAVKAPCLRCGSPTTHVEVMCSPCVDAECAQHAAEVAALRAEVENTRSDQVLLAHLRTERDAALADLTRVTAERDHLADRRNRLIDEVEDVRHVVRADDILKTAMRKVIADLEADLARLRAPAAPAAPALVVEALRDFIAMLDRHGISDLAHPAGWFGLSGAEIRAWHDALGAARTPGKEQP